ncbi:MAG: TolC family protein [Betaproteobacteria bacterium]|nr:TolC family protein [Betaproteobacteria bacterium]
MRFAVTICCLATVAVAHAQALQQAPDSVTLTSLTLEEALRMAEAASPSLQKARAELQALEADIVESRSPLWNNPEISAEYARRTTPNPGLPDERAREWALGISQAFETGGQSKHRRAAADSAKAAMDAQIEELRRQLRFEVQRGFLQVLSLQQRSALEEEAIRTVEQAANAVKSRVAAGEDTRLDGNVAAVEVGRAHNQLASLIDQLAQARAEFADLLQMPPGQLPQVQGDLGRTATSTYRLIDLLESSRQRPQFEALAQRERAARSRLALERAAVSPDVTVGIGIAREGPGDTRERIKGINVSVPLPLFRRNAAAIGRASSELTQVQIERQAAEREARASVIALWSRSEALRARIEQIRSSIVAALDENQRLSTRAYREGELGLLELLVVTRQVLDGRRDLLEAQTEAALTRTALEQAAGWADATRP